MPLPCTWRKRRAWQVRALLHSYPGTPLGVDRFKEQIMDALRQLIEAIFGIDTDDMTDQEVEETAQDYGEVFYG